MPRSNQKSPRSEVSYVSNGSPPSEASYLTTRTNRSGKIRPKIEVAANPICPRIRGLCCLLVLFNLALILICLGFALVLQFFEPGYVWYLGIFMLIFGFMTLVGSFIYCVVVCQEHRNRQEEESYSLEEPPPLYWGRKYNGSVAEFGSNSEINYDNRSGRSIDVKRNGESKYYHQDERY